MEQKKPEPRGVKTSVELPRPLWQAAKIRATEEGEPGGFRGVLVRALKAYLHRAGIKYRIAKKGDTYSLRCLLVDPPGRGHSFPQLTWSDVENLLRLMDVPTQEINRAQAELRAKGVGNIPEI